MLVWIEQLNPAPEVEAFVKGRIVQVD
jgi:hypothetical protein